MKLRIVDMIKQYVKKYEKRQGIETSWREPIVEFADADDKLFNHLKSIVSSNHALPEDLLKDAKTVITYFIPFQKAIAESNIEGKYSSRKWAVAYVETNKLISDLNQYLKNELEKLNYNAALIPATHNFDEERLISNWSHRHIAYIAGLGNFGINNMLITEKGCCGRVGSLVINIDMEVSNRVEQEYCLNKQGERCQKCVNRCINGALGVKSFDRHKCYELLLENDKLYSELDLTDACGKCCVDLPCSFINPVQG